MNNHVVDELASCIEDLHQGAWKFIQLRGEPFDRRSLSRRSSNRQAPSSGSPDDIDLLGSRESIHLLLQTVFDWVKAGRCHARVLARKRNKIELTLLSLDGKHCVLFDLWIHLWQIDRGKHCLTYESCSSAVEDASKSIQRLPKDVEACVYLHHLVCKRKDLSADRVQHRLLAYAQQLGDEGQTSLSEKIADIASTQRFAPSDEQQTLKLLKKHLILSKAKRLAFATQVPAKLRDAWLALPRRTSAVAIMGCDGAGKTSLANELKNQMAEVDRVFTGKHLYRKSLTYKLAVIFIRPLLFQDRERFDEILAPLVYLRACLGLRLKLWRRKKTITLIDRSLLDFLYVNRKTDSPGFCRGRWLANFCGRRIPTLHCIVSHENVMQRKQEVTKKGHARYDAEMFEQLVQQCPTDYVAFNNDRPLEISVQALEATLRYMMR